MNKIFITHFILILMGLCCFLCSTYNGCLFLLYAIKTVKTEVQLISHMKISPEYSLNMGFFKGIFYYSESSRFQNATLDFISSWTEKKRSSNVWKLNIKMIIDFRNFTKIERSSPLENAIKSIVIFMFLHCSNVKSC